MRGLPLRSGPGPIMVPAALYDVDVLRTALQRRDLGTELPLVPVSATVDTRPKAYIHD